MSRNEIVSLVAVQTGVSRCDCLKVLLAVEKVIFEARDFVEDIENGDKVVSKQELDVFYAALRKLKHNLA